MVLNTKGACYFGSSLPRGRNGGEFISGEKVELRGGEIAEALEILVSGGEV